MRLDEREGVTSLEGSDGDRGCGVLGILFLFVFPICYLVYALVKAVWV